MQVKDDFRDEQLLAFEDTKPTPWFADYVNYLVAKVIALDFSYQQKKNS